MSVPVTGFQAWRTSPLAYGFMSPYPNSLKFLDSAYTSSAVCGLKSEKSDRDSLPSDSARKAIALRLTFLYVYSEPFDQGVVPIPFKGYSSARVIDCPLTMGLA
ncbi:hypothetical protein MJO29_002966 [Puccinia striiformis f. sp. tritici]|nr:hypothetical protein MJO29_002966 [Puccinia striiformis f. sp. tritici]